MSEMVKVTEIEVGDQAELPGGARGRVHVKTWIPSREEATQIALKVQLPINQDWMKKATSYPSTSHTFDITDQVSRISRGPWHAS